MVFFVSFAPLFQQIGRLEVGDVELDGERVLLEGPRQGKAAAPDGVVEAAMCQRMATASSTLSFMKRSMRNTLFSPWP